jgi:hypothetical protein
MCAGCVDTHSYVDPKFRDADYLSIRALDKPHPIILTVHYQINGKPLERMDARLRNNIIKDLAPTRTFSNADIGQTNQAGRLEITVNNVNDNSDSSGSGKRAALGITFGLVGYEKIDKYVMTAIYMPAEGSQVTKTYNHAIYTIVGAHSAPEGMEESLSGPDAFDKVIEDMLLNFVRDLQKSGNL